jgi:hypothetical protein
VNVVKDPRLNVMLVLDLRLSRCVRSDDGELLPGVLSELQQLTYSGSGDIGDPFASCIDPRQNAVNSIYLTHRFIHDASMSAVGNGRAIRADDTHTHTECSLENDCKSAMSFDMRDERRCQRSTMMFAEGGMCVSRDKRKRLKGLPRGGGLCVDK